MKPAKTQEQHVTIFEFTYIVRCQQMRGNEQLIASIQSDGLPPVFSMIRGSAQNTVEDLGRFPGFLDSAVIP